MELYIHIPFCERKCLYCDFLSDTADAAVIERYTRQLAEEIREAGKYDPGRQVVSVFLGGGTPSLLLPEQTERILAAARRTFCFDKDAEVTIEANPGTLNREKLFTYRSLGINRLSLGLQSADDGELRELGRIHSFDDFLTSFSLAREEGFSNINVDLMSALPGQTKASYQNTLEAVTALSPEHLSAYSLIIEEGTPFYERYGKKNGPNRQRDGGKTAQPYPALPGEELDRWMYHRTKTFLSGKGYERYEISNYAKPGFECRHNVGYWTGIEYLGFGLGASSYIEGARCSNETDLETYLNIPKDKALWAWQSPNRRELSVAEKMEEFMFLGLRLMKGVSPVEFFDRFGLYMEVLYQKQIEALISNGLLEYDPGTGRLKLTNYGIDVSNTVLTNFLLD